jgi:SAM-dependent methyltransferase
METTIEKRKVRNVPKVIPLHQTENHKILREQEKNEFASPPYEKFAITSFNKVLDIGCGCRPKGDVNCDLFIGRTPHTEQSWTINPTVIPNFVRCDAHFLPFRDNSFLEVYSHHLLEHVDDPTKVLLEMFRVAKRKVRFEVPHRFQRTLWLKYKQCSAHKRVFNKKNIKKWLEKLNMIHEIVVTGKDFPHFLLPILRLPWEIKVEIYKGKD